MPMSGDRVAELLNSAFADLRTLDGLQLAVRFESPEGSPDLSVLLTLSSGSEQVEAKFRRWAGLPVPDGTSEARLAAFADGLRRATAAWDWATYSDSFPDWTPLSDPSLETADDFTSALTFAGLGECGLIGNRPFVLDELFTTARYADAQTEVVHLGEIDIGSGDVLVCDPYQSRPSVAAASVRTGAVPGRYPVRLAVLDLQPWGRRVVAGRLDLAAHPATSWRLSNGGCWVDSGLAGFMSVEAAGAFNAAMDEFDAAHPGRNYHRDVLELSLAASIPPERRGDTFAAGKWGLHASGDGQTIAVFASGLGDGSYDVLEGLDDAGRIVVVVVDFGILPDCGSDHGD